jgi:carbon storage regulator
LQQEAAMLVLSRKKNESIIIDDQIRIVVVEVRGDKVRLGIEAPRDIPVHRQEVHDAIATDLGAAKSAENPATPDALTGD